MSQKTISDAASIILSEMSSRDKLRIRNTKKEDLILLHFTWGQEIRNRLELWTGGEPIKDVGVSHPDSVSTVIMETVWEVLQKG